MLRSINVFKRLPKLLNVAQQTANSSNEGPSSYNYKVAVVLSGCGVYDGSEIHEAVATAAHLSRRNIEPLFYAPQINQSDVMNHFKGEPLSETRCVLTEAARIARGSVKPLNELKASDVDAAVYPGGFGAAKNLSNFASEGPACSLQADVSRIITELHKLSCPQAFMCISPVLAAKAIPGVKITLGKKDSGSSWPHAGAIDAAQAMGAVVELKNVNEVCVDGTNLILSTPAFMYNGMFHEIYDGIGALIQQLEIMLKNKAQSKC